MNTVINYASVKPSDPLRGYSYVHDSDLRQPRQIAVLQTMTVIRMSVASVTASSAANIVYNHRLGRRKWLY